MYEASIVMLNHQMQKRLCPIIASKHTQRRQYNCHRLENLFTTRLLLQNPVSHTQHRLPPEPTFTSKNADRQGHKLIPLSVIYQSLCNYSLLMGALYDPNKLTPPACFCLDPLPEESLLAAPLPLLEL